MKIPEFNSRGPGWWFALQQNVRSAWHKIKRPSSILGWLAFGAAAGLTIAFLVSNPIGWGAAAAVAGVSGAFLTVRYGPPLVRAAWRMTKSIVKGIGRATNGLVKKWGYWGAGLGVIIGTGIIAGAATHGNIPLALVGVNILVVSIVAAAARFGWPRAPKRIKQAYRVHKQSAERNFGKKRSSSAQNKEQKKVRKYQWQVDALIERRDQQADKLDEKTNTFLNNNRANYISGLLSETEERLADKDAKLSRHQGRLEKIQETNLNSGKKIKSAIDHDFLKYLPITGEDFLDNFSDPSTSRQYLNYPFTVHTAVSRNGEGHDVILTAHLPDRQVVRALLGPDEQEEIGLQPNHVNCKIRFYMERVAGGGYVPKVNLTNIEKLPTRNLLRKTRRHP